MEKFADAHLTPKGWDQCYSLKVRCPQPLPSRPACVATIAHASDSRSIGTCCWGS